MHVCLSDYFKDESERRGRMIREQAEMMVNGPGGVLASSQTFEAVKKTIIKALCQHTSKAHRHLNKLMQVCCLGPEHEEARCQRKSDSQLMHNEPFPVKTLGTNVMDVARTGLSCDPMPAE